MRKSLSLVEVIVSSVILALVFGSLLLAFVAARSSVERATKRLTAFNIARSTMNDLFREVRQDEWDDGYPASIDGDPVCPLYASPDEQWYTHELPDYTIAGIDYQDNSYATRNVAGMDYREARMYIHYPVD
jgi:type II secretory pathway pseudopilin PulG